MYAAYRNHVPSIKALVAAGADIERAAPGGYTPLSVAIAERRFEGAIALVELGANVNGVAGDDRVTPLMVAASQLVLNEQPEIDASGHRRPGPIEVATALVDHGAEANARSARGVTALMIAATHNNVPMIGFLAKSGAKFDLALPDGKTALVIANENRSEAAAKMIGRLQSTAGQAKANVGSQ
jgi:ankyrin repeat protein